MKKFKEKLFYTDQMLFKDKNNNYQKYIKTKSSTRCEIIKVKNGNRHGISIIINKTN